MSNSDIGICNTALLLVNASQINSFSDSTRESRICNALYQNTKLALLSKHPWAFSLFQESLARTNETPLFDYTYSYQLPTGYVRALKVDNLGNDYRILKDKLFSDQTLVNLLYQKDPGEEFFPAYFIRLLEFKLAELLSLGLVQDESMAKAFQQSYLLAMREARGSDSQSTPNLNIQELELSLTAVRGVDQ